MKIYTCTLSGTGNFLLNISYTIEMTGQTTIKEEDLCYPFISISVKPPAPHSQPTNY